MWFWWVNNKENDFEASYPKPPDRIVKSRGGRKRRKEKMTQESNVVSYPVQE